MLGAHEWYDAARAAQLGSRAVFRMARALMHAQHKVDRVCLVTDIDGALGFGGNVQPERAVAASLCGAAGGSSSTVG